MIRLEAGTARRLNVELGAMPASKQSSNIRFLNAQQFGQRS
jgi:hypothetical protein